MNIGIITNGIHCRFNDVDSHKNKRAANIYICAMCFSDYVHKMSSVVFMAVGENPSKISYYHLEKIFPLILILFGNSDTLQCVPSSLCLSVSFFSLSFRCVYVWSLCVSVSFSFKSTKLRMREMWLNVIKDECEL